ncbi:metal-dependent hydrolase [Halorussus halophilus]|uniref:metal-dependent hydrolase n=1 Tax=Halorussus halophilus TaxID=2650975 RepID=UPI0013016F43|nr:metal-dependent hydrolase [Halorussus halophilus]
MVDVTGHLGMALIWLAPAWYFIDHRKSAAAFVFTGFWFGMLPDVDLVLSNYVETIHHHGIFHTVLVVTILAAVLGPALGWTMRKLFGRTEWFSARAEENAIALGFVGVWVAGLAHLFADMLSAPDVSTPIEPFWPLFHGGLFSVDVLWYKSFWATWALLFVGIALNAGLWYWKGQDVNAGDSVAT